MSDYWKKKKNELKKEQANSSSNYWRDKLTELEKEKEKERLSKEMLAPLATKNSSSSFDYSDYLLSGERSYLTRRAQELAAKKEEEKGLDFFQKGALEDGGGVGDALIGAAATVADASVNVTHGALSWLEGIGDWGTYRVADLADLVGLDSAAEWLRKDAAVPFADNLFAPADEFYDKYSYLGRTSDAITQGVGQIAPTVGLAILSGGAGLGTAGTTAATTGSMYMSGAGSGTSQALSEGASYDQAKKYGIYAGAVEAISEMLFAGLGKGANAVGLGKSLTGLDDMVASALSKVVGGGKAGNFAAWLTKAGFEGVEELVSAFGQAYAKQQTYMTEEDFGKILEDENLLEQFVVGLFTSGIAQGGDLISANKSGRDFVTGLNADEQTVLDKVFEEHIAEREKNGEKFTNSQKSKLYETFRKQMEKGYVSVDAIESALGGETYEQFKTEKDNFFGSDTYKAYEKAVLEEKALQTEYEELGKKENPTLADQARFNELKSLLEDADRKSTKDSLKAQLDQEAKRINEIKGKLRGEVSTRVKDGYLAESYRELVRKGEKYSVDVSKYEGNARKTIQNILDSGLGDNTNQFHEYADFLARISKDKALEFDLTNNEALKGTEHYFEGKVTNGFVTEDGKITINKDSPRALNVTVGHEVTHVLEQAGMYKDLQQAVFDYAISKEGLDAFNKRLKDTEARYKNIKGTTAETELAADLVGEYLFTDYDFVNNLAVKNRNVFQKAFDEVKYLLSIATAGSKEARELEKVKRLFEKAYNETIKGQKNTNQTGGVRYSYSRPNFNKDEWAIVNRRKHSEFDNPKFDLDTDKKWMYVNEKGSTVFAIYSKHDAEDPTVLYGSSGKKAEQDHAKLNRFFAEDKDYATNNRTTFDRILKDIKSAKGNTSNSVSPTGGRGSTDGDVFLPVREPGSNGRGDFVDGSGNLRAEELTEYNEEASDESGASFVTFSNDYAAIRNFMKEGDTTEEADISAPVNQQTDNDTKYSVSAQTALETFGTTNDFAQAGFAMANGQMLKLSQYGQKGVQHKIIERIYEDSSGSDAINRFIQEGNVRIKESSPGIELGATVAPTTSQLNTIARFADESLARKGYFYLDITDQNGDNIATVEYDDDVSTADILYDIKKYYERGRIPKNTAKYSLADSDGRQLSQEQQEFFRDSVVRDEEGHLKTMYHGTSDGGHTVFDTYGSNYGLFGTGSYFTDSKTIAESYTKKGKGTNPQVYESYLNITNPMDMDAQADPAQWQEAFPDASFPDSGTNEAFYREMEEYFRDNEYPRWEAAEAAMDALMGMGYDGVTHIGGGRVNADGERHQVYIAFHPEQIKNTDNVKPTGNPDIRYSVSDDTWSQIREMQAEVNRLTDAIHKFEASEAFKAQVKKVSEALDAGNVDSAIKDYQRFLEESGHQERTSKRNALRDELEALRKSAEETRVSEALEAERKAIEESGLSEADYFRKQAVKEFGYTPYFYDAGYITTNGKMLNFSGEKGQHFGSRGQDHRAIGAIYADTDGTAALNRFVNDGNIRIVPESPGLDLSATTEPTKEQYATIRKFIYQYANQGYFSIDISDQDGRVVGSLEYENRINPTRIIGDLQHYYATGEIRQPSSLEGFRYSVSEDSEGRDVPAELQDLLQFSKVRDEGGHLIPMYHGTPNGSITQFNAGTYFTDNKEYADRYQNPSASSISTGKTISDPKTFEVYLDIRNPFDIASDAEARRIYIEEYIKGGNAIGINPYLSDAEYSKINTIDWTEGEDLRDFLIENGYDYDGIVLDEGADGGYGEDVKYRGKSYVIFSPDQVVNIADATGRSSLSDIGELQQNYGNYQYYGKDIGLPADPLAEFAPTKEDVVPAQSVAPEATSAPVQATEEEMFPDDPSMVEDETSVQERFDSITDEDAPPETEMQYDSLADTMPLDKKDIANIARDVKDALGLSSKQMGDVRNLIEEYSRNEFPSREQLFSEIKNNFGNYAETAKDETITEAKKHLRTVPIAVSDTIIGDIPDFAAFRRSNRGKIRFSQASGMPVDSAYHELSSMYPHLFPESIVNPTDQFLRMVDVANMDGLKKIEFPVDDGVLWSVTNDIADYVEDLKRLQKEKDASEYPGEAFESLIATADQNDSIADAPIADAPIVRAADAGRVAQVVQDAPVAEAYEAIRPKPEKAVTPEVDGPVGDKLVRVDRERSDNERRWVGTSTQSEAVDGKVLPEDLDQDLIHYQPISNKKTLGNANARLESLGYEASVAYLNGKFTEKKVSLDDIALGERLIQEAVKRGDTKTAGDLIVDISILGTEMGQKVQALSIIQRLTPEGQLKALRRTIERGKAKGDKAYEGVELTQEIIDKILQVYAPDGTFDMDKLNAAVEEAKQKVADQMQVTTLDKVNAWRYLSMLGNPKTHIRNLVSNVAMRGTVAVKNAVARTVESIVRPENRTKTWTAPSKAVKDFAKQKTIEMKDILSDDSKYSEDATIKEKRAIFKSKILNGLYEFNSDMLSKEDWWFSKPAFTNSLSEFLTANGIRTEEDIKNNPKLVQKAVNYATEQSQIATFRQHSWLASKINEIERKNTATNIAVGAILPFKKTPINIAKTGLSYSPLGFAKTLTYDAAQVKKGNMEASELIDHLAQNITGTGLTLAGYLLASLGFLSGVGEDDKEGKYDYQLGESSYSVNIDGTAYSLSWLSPVAMPLFVGANAFEQLVEGKEWNGDVVVETLAKTLDPLSEMSFLSSLDSVLSSYDSGIEKFAGIGEAMVQNYVTQFAPTLLGQVATAMDDTKRSTKVGADSGFKIFDQTVNKFMLKVPGLRQLLEPSTDIWGNEVKQTENGALRTFESFLAPWSKTESIATDVDAELKTLFRETGENGILPGTPANYVNFNDEKYEMSKAEYTTFKKTYGQTAFNLMEQLFDMEAYQNAGYEAKVDMVNRVYDYASDVARKEYFDKHGVTFTNATKDGKEVYKEDPVKGAIESGMLVDEYVFATEDPEKYEIAKKVGGYDAYMKYRDGMKDMKLGEKAAYVADLDLTNAQKNALINGETDRKEPIDLTGYNTSVYSSFEEFEYAKENPGKYTVSKAVGGYDAYRTYSSELYDIKADKDKNGKSISGSRKEKVLDYINSLDADYGEKLILFKSEYTADDTYNYEIIDYLNSRDDISYEEMETILKELGFTIDARGNISW